MLNFRKLKQDYSPAIIKEGRQIFEKGMVVSSKIVSLKPNTVRLSCKVLGHFDNTYQCEIEIDRHQSMTIDSDCDCTYKYDCQHLSAVLFFLEEKFDEILLSYSKENDLEKSSELDAKSKASLRVTLKEVETKEVIRQDKKNQKELIQEYISAAKSLGKSPFFIPEEQVAQDTAELAVLVSLPSTTQSEAQNQVEIQIALRLPYRSKPLNIPNLKEFLDALRYNEPFYCMGKRYFFSTQSFEPLHAQILQTIIESIHFIEPKDERSQRTGFIDIEAFGLLLAQTYQSALKDLHASVGIEGLEYELPTLPGFYLQNLEQPLKFAPNPAKINIALEYLEAPAPKLFLKPTLSINSEQTINLEEAKLFECSTPGILYQDTYFAFSPHIKRKHLKHLSPLRDITIPEPLFGTFVENSLPELLRFCEVTNRDSIERFVTLPYAGKLKGECDIEYLNGELEAQLHFLYDNIRVPAESYKIAAENISPFVTKKGILARNLTEEQKILDHLFQDFAYNPSQGTYISKNDKKIVEFMTEVIPLHQNYIKFNCPENLLDQFIYDDTTFELHLQEADTIDHYKVSLKVNGNLNGITIDQLWECISSKRTYIELTRKKGKKKTDEMMPQKILVLDLDRLKPVVHLFDEIGIKELTDHQEKRPLWSLANINPEQFKELPIKFSITPKLLQIQKQMMGTQVIEPQAIPKEIAAEMRTYQVEGIHWLDKLRTMHLSGILADDMGLGKTLQAITAVSQNLKNHPKSTTLIICPTSLVYNWKEEFHKFNPKIKVLPVDGTPAQRKKLINDIGNYNVIITSYSLLQKDIEIYKTINFSYAILDEAQHIKNRSTRNAKSVKQIQAQHRLILTGTPLENSLEDLWSLFDYLMPGFLSSYDRFVDKYIRNISPEGKHQGLEMLRKKVSPFILRRMKKDVIDDLPEISHLPYYCHLSDLQRDLYNSYAASAREELTKLVKKEGFEKVQIHVLATLTRLKQICCHPAIFAKETPEIGDSAKYDLLMDLLQNLIAGNHKTVIFSQYTKMLHILREDLEKRRIKFEYLDGTSKNRLNIVKKFNEDQTIPIFLVSLKAGGVGLNLVGADTVIHYDMWWNPAVENQATDRVHRIGQKNSVSSYKLITLNSIEEKILELQKRKSGLVTQLVTCFEDVIAKLTWEEVLELLQT